MRRRDQRRAHMGDERDAARPKAGIVRCARDLVAELGREFAGHGRDVDPDLLEHPAVHDRDRAAAAFGPLPIPALEATRHTPIGAGAGIYVLDRLEVGADAVAEQRKPGLGRGALRRIWRKDGRIVGHGSGNNSVWRNPSASATAPASATLSDRAPGRNGITTRAAAARCA